jgi:hypothetical protein
LGVTIDHQLHGKTTLTKFAIKLNKESGYSADSDLSEQVNQFFIIFLAVMMRFFQYCNTTWHKKKIKNAPPIENLLKDNRSTPLETL